MKISLEQILTQGHIYPKLKVGSKKQALHLLSQKLAIYFAFDEAAIFKNLMDRERLGTTAIGDGLALPHLQAEFISQTSIFFLSTKTPIDFEAPDSLGVDLIIFLAAPQNAGADHLKILARLARFLKNKDQAKTLRGANDRDAIFAILSQAFD